MNVKYNYLVTLCLSFIVIGIELKAFVFILCSVKLNFPSKHLRRNSLEVNLTIYKTIFISKRSSSNEFIYMGKLTLQINKRC